MIIGIKSGTFTILTKGHVECLHYCKQLCDKLIVVVNSDDYLIYKKGFCAVPIEERARILRAIRDVDHVIPYSGPNEHDVVRTICKEWRKEYKDVSEPINITLFHSRETINKDFVPGAGIVDNIEFCPEFDSSSTSDIMNRIWADNIGKVERL